ncbi:MAG: hypothetical protein AAFX96_09705, partial [Pseudomonadota bacterium]
SLHVSLTILLRYDMINCHPLTNTMTTTISREDLLAFLAHVGHDPEIIKVSTTPEIEQAEK